MNKIRLKQLIKEEIDNLPLHNVNKKYEFSYNEINMMNIYLYKIYTYFENISDNSPEFNDRKKRLENIIKLINKKIN